MKRKTFFVFTIWTELGDFFFNAVTVIFRTQLLYYGTRLYYVRVGKILIAPKNQRRVVAPQYRDKRRFYPYKMTSGSIFFYIGYWSRSHL